MKEIVTFIFILLISCGPSEEFSRGAPIEACGTLTPSHRNAETQQLPSPYVIEVSTNTIGNGESLTVEIRSNQPGRLFRGFLLQARTTQVPVEIEGSFVGSYNFVGCSGVQSTVTNSNSTDHAGLVFDWTAPREYTGRIRFQ